MDNVPLVSVIIVNWNGKRYLERCLSSLEKNKYKPEKMEIIIVDNNSSDGSVEFVRKFFPDVFVLKLDKNYGFAGGNNRGVRFAKGKYIVFLNNDTQVTKEWLSELVQASTKHSASICTSKTLFMENCKVVQFGGGKFTTNGRGYSVAIGKKDRDEAGCVYTGYPCAASMLIKKDVFLRLGEFDEDYFATLDDTDLGWRAWLYGYKVLYCPTSIVYHVTGGTAGRGRISPLKAFHGTKNALMNLLKSLEPKNLLLGVVLALIYDLIETLLLVKCKDVKCVKMKVKAHYWVIKNLRSILQKRHVIQKNRTVSDEWLLNAGLMASLKEAVHEYVRLSKLNFNVFWKDLSKDNLTE